MAIFRGSRYEGLSVTGIVQVDDSVRPFLHTRTPITRKDIGPDFTIHSVEVGDELDDLAFKHGKKATLGWIIADVNEIFFPLQLEVGRKLIIPNRRFFAKF